MVLAKAKEYQPHPSLNLPRPSPSHNPPPPGGGQIRPPTTPSTVHALEKPAAQLQEPTPSRQKLVQEKSIKGALIYSKTALQIKKDLAAAE